MNRFIIMFMTLTFFSATDSFGAAAELKLVKISDNQEIYGNRKAEWQDHLRKGIENPANEDVDDLVFRVVDSKCIHRNLEHYINHDWAQGKVLDAKIPLYLCDLAADLQRERIESVDAQWQWLYEESLAKITNLKQQIKEELGKSERALNKKTHFRIIV